MKNPFSALVLVVFCACTSADTDPIPCSDETGGIDFSGTASQTTIGDSISIVLFSGDFIGELYGSSTVATDSSRYMTATLVGRFVAPLGDDKKPMIKEARKCSRRSYIVTSNTLQATRDEVEL